MRFFYLQNMRACTQFQKVLNKTFLKNYFELYLYDESSLTCDYLLTYNVILLCSYRQDFSSS